MSKIDLDPITSGYNLSKINDNFQKVEDELNNKVLYRNSPAGEPNSMSSNLDMNSRSILNASKISSKILELDGVQVVPTSLVVDPYNGTREALRRSYAEAGYNLVDGSFEAGGTLVNANDVLLQERTGKAFSGPAGSVPAGTSPIGGGFTDRSGDLLRLLLSAASGAERVGYGGGTVATALDNLASDLAPKLPLTSPPRAAMASSLWANGAKCTTLIGDSISHGAFAGNLYSHGITRLLARALNGEFGTTNYGFTPMLSLGGTGGAPSSVDIHDVNFTNAGTGWAALDAANGSAYLNGFAFRSTNVGNTISFSLPTFQHRAIIHHANQTGGGSFTVSVNGGAPITVNTGADSNKFAATEIALADNQYGRVTITISTTNALPVDICGISYFSSTTGHVLQNMSQSGRRARHVSAEVITEVCSKSATVVFALGQNDYAETDPTYIAAVTTVITNLIAASNANGCRMVVSDFCWMAPESNWMRIQLRRLAKETSGIYVPFPDLLLKPDGSSADTAYLVSSLGMWFDGSHPNEKGCKWIFETLAKYMGLACNSKEDALKSYDYWMPVALVPEVGIENSIPNSPSSCKRTKSGVVFRFFLEESPYAAFPTGAFTISNSFPARTDITGSGFNTVQSLMKIDASGLIGGVHISASGEVKLNITTAPVYNDLYFSVLLT